jgi:outer membrane protein assembly factor BamB
VFQPIIDRDHVVVTYTTFTAPNAGGVAAFDRRTGEQRWRSDFHARGSSTPSAAAGGPVAAHQLIFAASSDGIIYGFERKSGRPRWSIPAARDRTGRTPDRDHRPLVAVGRMIVAGSLTGCTVSYDVITHAQVWRYCDPAGASVAFAIGADQQTVYAPYYEGRLVALDAGSGQERWHIGHPGGGFNWLPAFDGTRLYVAGSTAVFFALSRR